MSHKYEKYEYDFDMNVSELNRGKINIREYEKKFDEIIDTIKADEREKVFNILNKGNCEKYKANKNPKWCKNVRCDACILMQIKECIEG